MSKSLYLMCVLGAILAAALLPLAPVQAQTLSDPTMEDPLYPVDDPAQAHFCARNLTADVVALDQVYFWNRLGAVQPHGMMYALRSDVVSSSSSTTALNPGKVQLRSDKRPRPLTLRMNVGDCMTVKFTNLLSPSKVDGDQPATRSASVHVMGMQYVENIRDGGLSVGNVDSTVLALPGETRFYKFYAEREGTFLMYSGGALNGGDGNNGSLAAGLFGAVNVEPRSSEWYRSQVTESDMKLATVGTTAQGHPILNYDAVYPATHKLSGRPIFKMLQNNAVVHGDLTAIITGPNRGRLSGYPPIGVTPDRNQPFREFTIIFHDEIGAVQAFPIFEDPIFSHTTHSTRDAFAINYGTGGIGAEILANRIGVGPMWDCTECKYEEFFLTSWAVGDPAMVVDVPANAPCTYADIRKQAELAKQGITVQQQPACTPTAGPKATKAFYPDDPSNVYHSYLNDHVKFRNLLAGSDDHHIFHLHAHQWLHTPDSDLSTYLDSQAIGQGTGFTYEITWGGSGNRNKTAGDSIFHCHFYPHFAQGMWGMWRVHDVFEKGSQLDANGRPVNVKDSAGNVITKTRALPDAEILAGTPIPGVVPIPTIAMAPMPQAAVTLNNGQVQVANTGGNPGYPFWVPGVAGHRPPHPPMDTIDDGGLQRHVIVAGDTFHVETRLDFTKIIEKAQAIALPEGGTNVELVAMKFHAQPAHASFKPDGSAASFATNGLAPTQGAPYAEPCPAGYPHRLYKGADIEVEAVLNKKGWHFPQQRMISLWDDVLDFKYGNKPLEPLFFRANSGDCITFWLTNLVPGNYELDDFQVRTPTDVLGQHIHLVKFDVTSSDGSANGYNYEDGSFSPEEVQERILAIRAFNGCAGGVLGGDPRDGSFTCPVAKPHPFFGGGKDHDNNGIGDWFGAQTTVQRWWADPVTNLVNGDDRTLRTVFTHDHFGPSTHQQGGLYAGLVVEPKGSTWFHNETGAQLGGRHDGGPTTWQAVIKDPDVSESYREFLFEFADFQLAYEPNNAHPLLPYPHRARQPGEGFDHPATAINPPGRFEVGLPALYESPFQRGKCPTEDQTGTLTVLPPCPELVSADDPAMYSVNYRNEPLALRLRDPNTGKQAAGTAGDPSYAYSSKVTRLDPALNTQPSFGKLPLTGDVRATDPFTPLLRAYEGDNVQIRIMVGAHEEEHNFTVHGIKWLFEPSDPNSGYRNSQMMGISEHFEFLIPQLPKAPTGEFHDFLYKPGAAVESQWNGNWGILRAYRSQRADVQVLPNNPIGVTPTTGIGSFTGVCPKTAPVRNIDVVAIPASKLPGGTLTYYKPFKTVTDLKTGAVHQTPLQDPTAIVFVRGSEYDFLTKTLKPQPTSYRREPLILRAAAGECINVTLYNELPATKDGRTFDLPGYNAFPHIVRGFNANDVKPSARVGLHPQLVAYDVTKSDGVNVGFNPEQTVPPGQKIQYQWYAGDVSLVNGTWTFKPIEFGSTGLTSSDPLKHTNKGAVGALIIEPQGAAWSEDAGQLSSAWVKTANGTQFREHVTIYQTDVNLRYFDDEPVKPAPENEDPAERGQKALNYSADPIWVRMGFAPESPLEMTRDKDFTGVLSVAFAGPPQTPIFTAPVWSKTRMRVLNPGGHGQAGVYELSGHIWQELPYVNNSAAIGNRPISEYKGSEFGIGATRHYDVVVQNGAGGAFGIVGDYLYRDYASWMMFHGLWGVFRVTP